VAGVRAKRTAFCGATGKQSEAGWIRSGSLGRISMLLVLPSESRAKRDWDDDLQFFGCKPFPVEGGNAVPAILLGEFLGLVGALPQFAVGQRAVGSSDANTNGYGGRSLDQGIPKGGKLATEFVQEGQCERPGHAGKEDQVFVASLPVSESMMIDVCLDRAHETGKQIAVYLGFGVLGVQRLEVVDIVHRWSAGGRLADRRGKPGRGLESRRAIADWHRFLRGREAGAPSAGMQSRAGTRANTGWKAGGRGRQAIIGPRRIAGSGWARLTTRLGSTCEARLGAGFRNGCWQHVRQLSAAARVAATRKSAGGQMHLATWQSDRRRPVHLAHVEPSVRKLNGIRNLLSPSNLHSGAGLHAPTWLNCAHRLRRGISEKNGQTGLTIPWGGMVRSTMGSDGLVALPRPRPSCKGRTIRDTENPAS